MTPRYPLIPTALAIAMIAGGAHAFEPAGEEIAYDVNGETFQGYLARAEGEARGSVLIIHDWDGLDDYERRRADMLAEQGYDAFAADLYGQGNRPAETEARKAETARLYEDRERMRALTLAGLAEARAQGVASHAVIMGYCFGGAVVLEMARSGEADDVHGFASFHGGLATPEDQSWPDGAGSILVAHGGADASISMDDVATLGKELEDAGATYQIEIYSGAPHAFTVFGSDAYQQRADERSWSAFIELLEEVLE